jgi:transcriptional regulator with XRE-family HTH domain
MTPPPAVNISIRQIRESAGISQAELARRLGVTQPNVARWESGTEKIRVDTLQRIADALGLSLAVIFSAPPPKSD